METSTVTHVHRDENPRPDSIEIGSPSKGGAVKIYFNAADPAKACELVDHAMVVRSYAMSKLMSAQEGK